MARALLAGIWLGNLFVLVILMSGLRASAQDSADGGWNGEQGVLIDRVVQVRANLRGSLSYHQESSGSDRQTLTVSLGNASRAFDRSVTWTQSIDRVLVDGEDNLRAEASAVVSLADGARYSVNAQARVIEGALYVNAAFVPPAPEQIELPDDWARVEDLSDIYEDLHLDDLVDPSPVYSDAVLLRAMVSEATQETRVLEDGTPVEIITLVFERGGLIHYLRETQGKESPALSDMIYDAVDSNSYAQSILVIGPEQMPLQFAVMTVIETAEIDAHTLNPDEFIEGTRLRIRLERSGTNVYSQMNEPLEPARVPDELARKQE